MRIPGKILYKLVYHYIGRYLNNSHVLIIEKQGINNLQCSNCPLVLAERKMYLHI